MLLSVVRSVWKTQEARWRAIHTLSGYRTVGADVRHGFRLLDPIDDHLRKHFPGVILLGSPQIEGDEGAFAAEGLYRSLSVRLIKYRIEPAWFVGIQFDERTQQPARVEFGCEARPSAEVISLDAARRRASNRPRSAL